MAIYEKTVEQIEQERLEMLRRKMAMLGPNTPPELLIELQQLTSKKQTEGVESWEDFAIALSITRNAVGAALIRLNTLSDDFKRDQEERPKRQRWNDYFHAAVIVLLVVLFMLVLFT